MGTGHNLTAKDKASEVFQIILWVFQTILGSKLISAVSLNKMPAANLFFFFKGRQDRDKKEAPSKYSFTFLSEQRFKLEQRF